MSGAIRAVRLAVRTLGRSPSFTWAAVLLLALGIGAGTAAFSIVDHVLLRPLPYPSPDRLVYMTNGAHSGPVLQRLDDVDAFEEWMASRGFDANLVRTGAEPLRLRGVEVTPSFFTMFAALPQAGRVLVEADENRRDVALLSADAWRRVWAGDSGVVGRAIQLDGAPVEIVGVLADDFVPPAAVTGRAPDLFVPMNWLDPNLERPGWQAHSVAARLAGGVSMAQGDEALDRLAADVAAAYPDYYESEVPDWPLESLAAQTVGTPVSRGLGLLLGAVGLLFLVACSNVAHLFLARGIGRVREMSVRRALGAPTRALVGQLLAESAVVGAAGGLLGVGLAWVALRGFGRWTRDLPRGEAVALDLRVLAFAVALSLTTVVFFGLLPALRSTRRDLHDTLRAGARGSSAARPVQALRWGLVVGEVAVSVVLVALSGLLMRSFVEVSRQDTGIVADNVWVVPLTLPGAGDGEAYVRTLTELTDAVRAMPGVRSATWSGELPFQNVGGNSCCWATRIQLADDAEPVRLRGHSVDHRFFETFGTEIVAGRGFLENESEPVAIVGERTAVAGWGSAEAALGRTLELRGAERRIVGVAEHTLHYGLDQPHDITAYIPAWQNAFAMPWASIAVRTGAAEAGIGGRIREAIWSVSPDLPIPSVLALEQMIDESASARRLGGLLSTSFGVLALLLAAGGLYGTLLYAVGEERRAIGIRLALGAGTSRIERAVVGRALVLGAAGVVVGLGAAWYLTRFVEAFLFAVAPRDTFSLGLSSLVLLAVAAVAAWIPARRAANTDPLETLRVE